MSSPTSPTHIESKSLRQSTSAEAQAEPPAAVPDSCSAKTNETQLEAEAPNDADEAVVLEFTNSMTIALHTAESNLNQTASEKVVQAMRSIFDFYRDIVDTKRMELARVTALADENEHELREWQRVSIIFANAVNGQEPGLASEA